MFPRPDQRGKDWELVAPLQQHNERVIDMNNFLDKMRSLAATDQGTPGPSEDVGDHTHDAITEG